MANSNSNEKPSFLSRAAHLLKPRGLSISVPPHLKAIYEHSPYDEKANEPRSSNLGDPRSPDYSAAEAHDDQIDRRRDVRTIPPWIHSLQRGEDTTEADTSSYLLPHVPRPTKDPEHLHVPTPKNGPMGKKMDQGRTREPVTISSPFALAAPRWQAFAYGATPPPMPSEAGHYADEKWREELLAGLDEPWNPAGMSSDEEKDSRMWLFSDDKRRRTVRNVQRVLMTNAFIPLVIRLTVLAFVIAALAVGVTIYQKTLDMGGVCQQQPSTYMAFIVDSIAVVYLLYITWDEYTNKPIGLRRSRDKIRLLLLDLLFVIFSAANVSLAFNTLTDRQWACHASEPAFSSANNMLEAQSTCTRDTDLCQRQQALAGLLVIALTAWLLTFNISLLRIVERMSH